MSRDLYRGRSKKVQKLGRDGLVEQDRATGEEHRVSQRAADVSFAPERQKSKPVQSGHRQKRSQQRRSRQKRSRESIVESLRNAGVEYVPAFPDSAQDRAGDINLEAPQDIAAEMRGAADIPLLVPAEDVDEGPQVRRIQSRPGGRENRKRGEPENRNRLKHDGERRIAPQKTPARLEGDAKSPSLREVSDRPLPVGHSRRAGNHAEKYHRDTHTRLQFDRVEPVAEERFQPQPRRFVGDAVNRETPRQFTDAKPRSPGSTAVGTSSPALPFVPEPTAFIEIPGNGDQEEAQPETDALEAAIETAVPLMKVLERPLKPRKKRRQKFDKKPEERGNGRPSSGAEQAEAGERQPERKSGNTAPETAPPEPAKTVAPESEYPAMIPHDDLTNSVPDRSGTPSIAEDRGRFHFHRGDRTNRENPEKRDQENPVSEMETEVPCPAESPHPVMRLEKRPRLRFDGSQQTDGTRKKGRRRPPVKKQSAKRFIEPVPISQDTRVRFEKSPHYAEEELLPEGDGAWLDMPEGDPVSLTVEPDADFALSGGSDDSPKQPQNLRGITLDESRQKADEHSPVSQLPPHGEANSGRLRFERQQSVAGTQGQWQDESRNPAFPTPRDSRVRSENTEDTPLPESETGQDSDPILAQLPSVNVSTPDKTRQRSAQVTPAFQLPPHSEGISGKLRFEHEQSADEPGARKKRRHRPQSPDEPQNNSDPLVHEASGGDAAGPKDDPFPPEYPFTQDGESDPPSIIIIEQDGQIHFEPDSETKKGPSGSEKAKPDFGGNADSAHPEFVFAEYEILDEENADITETGERGDCDPVFREPVPESDQKQGSVQNDESADQEPSRLHFDEKSSKLKEESGSAKKKSRLRFGIGRKSAQEESDSRARKRPSQKQEQRRRLQFEPEPPADSPEDDGYTRNPPRFTDTAGQKETDTPSKKSRLRFEKKDRQSGIEDTSIPPLPSENKLEETNDGPDESDDQESGGVTSTLVPATTPDSGGTQAGETPPPQTPPVREDIDVTKAEKRVEKVQKRLERAQKKIPTKRRLRIEKQRDSGTGRVKHRLQFEKEPVPEGGIPAPLPVRGVMSAANSARWTLVMKGHQKLREVERENAGLESAHKVELTVEYSGGQLLRWNHSRLREKPYRAVRQAERLLEREKASLEWRKALRGHPEPRRKKALSKWVQKQKIKRKYAQAAREAKQTVQHTQNVLNATGQIIRATAQYIAMRKSVLAAAALLILIALLFSVGLTSCMAMLSSFQSSYISVSYMADEEDLCDADLYYTEMETDLQIDIDNTAVNHPGCDEYRYQVGEIGHNPFQLLSCLSTKYNAFKFRAVKRNIESLFWQQYTLNRTVVTETRYTSDGTPYRWRILVTTLAVRPLSGVIAECLEAGEETIRYGLYMQTYGNRQAFDSPFDFPWLGRVGSFYGYRKHPMTGVKNLHRGVDIGAPAGTEIKAIQDGRIVTAGEDDHYGLYVVIEGEKGYSSLYAHCSRLDVHTGQRVKRGDVIAAAGSTGDSTGPHLHLEVKLDGEYLNPIFFVETGGGGGSVPGGGVVIPDYPGEAPSDETFARMLEEAEKYLGYPYVWGGSSPATSFDCSGYVSWVINHSGWNVGRLGAQALYNLCTPVAPENARPGDLVFFRYTYNAPIPDGVTHVGIYVGNSQMIHCGSPISYADLNNSYWRAHFYTYARLPNPG